MVHRISARMGLHGDGGLVHGARVRLKHGRIHDLWRRVRARRASRAHRDVLARVSTVCLFIGHARSGHSVLGALLGAHPDAVISDELDALYYVEAGFTRAEILGLCLAVASDQAQGREKQGRDGRSFSFEVPGWWQGRWDTLKVVGDSVAGQTAQRLGADPMLIDRLDRLFAPSDVRYLHVARNPFDNISTMMIRGGRPFESAVHRYFATCEALTTARPAIGPGRILTITHEDLIKDTSGVLSDVCEFLDLDIPDGYIEACRSILYSDPSRSSSAIEWNAAMEARVREEMATFDFLSPYLDTGPAPHGRSSS